MLKMSRDSPDLHSNNSTTFCCITDVLNRLNPDILELWRSHSRPLFRRFRFKFQHLDGHLLECVISYDQQFTSQTGKNKRCILGNNDGCFMTTQFTVRCIAHACYIAFTNSEALLDVNLCHSSLWLVVNKFICMSFPVWFQTLLVIVTFLFFLSLFCYNVRLPVSLSIYSKVFEVVKNRALNLCKIFFCPGRFVWFYSSFITWLVLKPHHHGCGPVWRVW